MRRGFVFNAARVAALASLGPAAYGLPGPVAERSLSVHEIQVLNALDDLWDQAWDADFVLHESGMGLTTGSSPNSWTVTVYRQQDVIASGSYDEVIRLLAPEAGDWVDALDEELASVELFVTAGLLHGLDGFLTPAWGLVRRIAVTGDDATKAIVVEGFTPLGTAESLDLAIVGAAYLFDTLLETATLPGGEPYTTDPCHCEEIHDNDLASCRAKGVSCDLRCTAIALAAIAACIGTGPFAPACMILIVAADAACIGSCAADYKACKLSANGARLRCLGMCPEAHP